MPNGSYRQVRYFINLKMYIMEFSRHYCNKIIFLLRKQSVMTVKTWVSQGHVIGEQLPTDRRSVGDRSAIDWRSVGRMFTIIKRSTTVQRPVGNRSAISRRLKTVLGLSTTTATSRQPVVDQSPTSLRPPKTFLRSIWSQRGFTCSKQMTKSSWRHSCDCCNLSMTPATSLRPPEIMVARRSPTDCRLCVTGA